MRALPISERMAAATFAAWENCSGVGLFMWRFSLFAPFFECLVYTLGMLGDADEVRSAHRAGGGHEAARFFLRNPREGRQACAALRLWCSGEIRLRSGHAPQRGVARRDYEARAQSFRPVIAAARAQVVEQPPAPGRRVGRDRA